MLFKDYPNITYVLKNKDINLVDIFRNVAFKNVEESNAYDDYYIQDGETPEIISARLYGNTTYSWLILLINNITNLDTEWFISAKEYEKTVDRDIGGDAFYIQELPNLQTGDIMVKVTAVSGNTPSAIDENTYRHIESFDPYFRKIRGICGSGTFSSGNNILFARKSVSGIVEPLEFDQKSVFNILFTERYQNSVEYFITSDNIVIDPYRKIQGSTIQTSSIDPGTTYSDPSDSITLQNFATTVIYRYGASGGIVPSLIKITENNSNYNKYIEKQKIKVLKPELLSIVLTSLENAIRSDNVGRIIKVVV
jgi:hypothetical protein